MLCTVQCRPAAACARKSPPRVHSKETRQDKTRFKCVGRNKYAMFDEVARERGTWDELCVEPQVRAFARRGFCKPCKKYYDDSKGLEAHERRHHPRPPSQDGEREV